MIETKKPLAFTIVAKLSDDSFEASLTIPITSSEEFVKTSFEAWLGTLYSAIESFAKTLPNVPVAPESDRSKGEQDG